MITINNNDRYFFYLVSFSFVLSLAVVALGAFTRLTEAGLGCPDWPGCYGFLTVPETEFEQQTAAAFFPQTPLEPQKAWNEMLHRYIAGMLGLFVVVINIMAWRQPSRPKLLPVLLLVMVFIQALLGMWTVTLVLMPVVVMAHLLGGFSIVSLLWLLRLQLQLPLSIITNMTLKTLYWLRIAAIFSVVVVISQIALGGWTAANYAALVCSQLPICEADWRQLFDAKAFLLLQPQHDSYQYGVLDYGQRVSIHVVHRIGAMITTVAVLALAWLCWLQPLLRRYSLGLVLLLIIQIALGVTNVVASLPLAVAVAHNVTGLGLLLAMVTVSYRVGVGSRLPREVYQPLKKEQPHG
ncbi:heme A synthase [Photobacterium kishitanii]|uniref:Heme A synthase n=1 Tax=Photobacterium kishitanii TaxID=318456 RepID=A0A2T3KI23_9GAMM|nr:COX15/CtaA family protein [Photobacterium kishitanii]KJG58141.1 cytochrome B561 [Photobacterium kishitanii]KJG61658.1 cytochrome B561 [Photobacterium kishitanii]KJG65956.1 cytochrome B561 [Photobacterium kishitanii]KJG69806.1 cytochrome B561 [Photobacterium kishitanii]OBU19509.1 cytochrome B [Photobacterium kishitanii]